MSERRKKMGPPKSECRAVSGQPITDKKRACHRDSNKGGRRGRKNEAVYDEGDSLGGKPEVDTALS